jgi:hypothetical protein
VTFENKDLLELASIRAMTQVIGLFGHIGSGNYYYKRVTFLTAEEKKPPTTT